MKRVLAVAFAAMSMSVAGAASAEWSAGGGFESFRWKETTTPSVKESGMRWALDLTWNQSRDPGPSAGYNLKFYQGNVDYTGATLFGGVPVSGETHYRGWTHEVRAYWRMPQNMVDVVLAGGWDSWSRQIQDSATKEDWNVLYAKLGADVNTDTRAGLFGGVGVKYPVWTRENAHFPDIGGQTNPRLHPGKSVSLYGNVGYRVNPNWDVIAYYESFRFKQSSVVAVPFPAPAGTLGFVQPESKMDVFGMKIQYNFK
jgi:hypothetical protein